MCVSMLDLLSMVRGSDCVYSEVGGRRNGPRPALGVWTNASPIQVLRRLRARGGTHHAKILARGMRVSALDLLSIVRESDCVYSEVGGRRNWPHPALGAKWRWRWACVAAHSAHTLPAGVAGRIAHPVNQMQVHHGTSSTPHLRSGVWGPDS